MSRYIFIGTEKDLIDNGFYDKEKTLNKKISNRHVIIFDKNNQTLIGKHFSFVDLEVFPFDITNAIQDLIDKRLVKELEMTSKERLDIIKQRVNTIRLNTKIGSRRIADEENAVLLDHIEYNLNEFYKLVERDTPKYLKQEKLLGLYEQLVKDLGLVIEHDTTDTWDGPEDYEYLEINYDSIKSLNTYKQIKELEKITMTQISLFDYYKNKKKEKANEKKHKRVRV